MKDILDSLAQIHDGFRAAGLESPTAIFLRSHEEGEKFISAVRLTSEWPAISLRPEFGFPRRMADGSTWMELRVLDVSVLWPAKQLAMPDGSWRWS